MPFFWTLAALSFLDSSLYLVCTSRTECAFSPRKRRGVNMVVLNLTLQVKLQFSPTGPSGAFSNTPVVKASTSVQGFTTMISIETEDSTDNDNNDSEVIINVQSPPTRIAVPQAVSQHRLRAPSSSRPVLQAHRQHQRLCWCILWRVHLVRLFRFDSGWAKVTGEILETSPKGQVSPICSP
ncbi:hypothetical protein BDP27DRAFT_1372447 [Rhodocollybia butyracea]|uniref:Uncharacterized protein n=1 Tax=Rhodocollybia butyracea TaxID=206335 RepID=A0A9P5TWN4_9AGAR|nr:hypothetical protein BDP27DRAFT_1372447 [Rhodocollybia butyracea]